MFDVLLPRLPRLPMLLLRLVLLLSLVAPPVLLLPVAVEYPVCQG
jgi:hypothetical protein